MSESTRDDAPRNALSEALKRRVVSCFDAALVGGSRHLAYIRELGMPADRILTGYDVVDNDYFADGASLALGEASTARKRLSLPPRYFLSSARFIEKKNLPFLVRAYARYRSLAEGEPWDLVVLGDGPTRAAVIGEIERLGVANHVHLHGFKGYGELPAYYGLAGAFVHCSTVEQWGLEVNEAMASGLPVIVSERCGCVPELVRNGVNGFSFDPTDEGQLAGLLVRMSSPELDRQGLGAASRKIISGLSPSRFAEGMEAAALAATSRPEPRRSLAVRLLTEAG